MSEILGHDVDGKPLRKGDRVVPTNPELAKRVGHPPPPWTIAGPSRRLYCVLLEEIGANGTRKASMCKALRRLPRPDHAPAEDQFTRDLKRRLGLGKGVPA